MNVLQTRKHIKKLYDRVFDIISNELLQAANTIYGEIYDEAVDMGFEGNRAELDENWVEANLTDYSSTTKYVFKNELERKRSRLFESIVADKGDSGAEADDYATSLNLVIKQLKQFVIELEDRVARKVYKDLGVKKVRWVAEKDFRTCDVCSGLDGQIFPLDSVPPKQHWSCRCHIIVVKE